MTSWKQLTLPILLGIGLFLLLLLPTIKSLKTVEADPNSVGFIAQEHQEIARNILLPDIPVEYVLLWVHEKSDQPTPSLRELSSLQLELHPAQGATGEVRTGEHPTYMMREGKNAILFDIQKLVASAETRYDITLRNPSHIPLQLQFPLKDHIKKDEQVTAAFQFAEKKNWMTLLIDKVYSENLIGNDISMYLHRGQQIASGTNPYSCVLEKGACIGYPAHMPGMYLVASAFVQFGVHDLDSWAKAWRPVAIMSWLAVGIVLLVHLTRKGYGTFAIAAFGFWLFNRWSLDVLRIAHTDFLGVLFLLLAVILIEKRPKTAAFLFGISLSIKQIAILIIPVFLLFIWQRCEKKVFAIALFLLILVPTLTLTPFLVNNAPATLTGLLNPLERPAQQVHGFASSFAQTLDITTPSKVFLMLYLIGIIYVAAYQKTLSLASSTLMIFVVMISFTHVLYNQYIVWMLPFIPLAISYRVKKSIEL